MCGERREPARDHDSVVTEAVVAAVTEARNPREPRTPAVQDASLRRLRPDLVVEHTSRREAARGSAQLNQLIASVSLDSTDRASVPSAFITQIQIVRGESTETYPISFPSGVQFGSAAEPCVGVHG